MTTVTLRARWNGDHPRTGEYLMARTRPRNAYRIVTITQRSTCLELSCERMSPASVPDGATVHEWRWDSRTKAGSAWSAT